MPPYRQWTKLYDIARCFMISPGLWWIRNIDHPNNLTNKPKEETAPLQQKTVRHNWNYEGHSKIHDEKARANSLNDSLNPERDEETFLVFDDREKVGMAEWTRQSTSQGSNITDKLVDDEQVYEEFRWPEGKTDPRRGLASQVLILAMINMEFLSSGSSSPWISMVERVKDLTENVLYKNS